MWCSWLVHILCSSTITKMSEHFKLFTELLLKLGVKKCAKLAKFNFFKKLIFQRVSKVQYSSMVKFRTHLLVKFRIQLEERSLKTSSHSDHICRHKEVKVLKTDYTNTYAPGNLSYEKQPIISLWLTFQPYVICTFQVMS